MSSGRITVERKGHVLLMGLNRPEKRNAFDLEMYLELAGAYGKLDREQELRCGLLFAHGDHFSPPGGAGNASFSEGCPDRRG